jgi:pimeloyl-ACP methyl ester carboxylesterase
LERLDLLYKASRLSYIRFGSGPKPAFCFHGYGEDATSFAFFEKYAGTQFTFYAIDLPFHGQTSWPDNQLFTPVDLQKIVLDILQRENPSFLSQQIKLTLIGFSLGGRIALSLYRSQPMITDKIVLLAPDGLKVNFWYWLSTQTVVGNKLFAFTMKHPQWFFGFLKMLNTLRLVNASIFKFVNYYIGDKEVRRLLYQRWTCLRKLKPHLDKIKSAVNEHQTKVRLVYGKHDRIILSSVGEKFKKEIEEHCTISVIHSGHQVLHEKHVHEILPALLH